MFFMEQLQIVGSKLINVNDDIQIQYVRLENVSDNISKDVQCYNPFIPQKKLLSCFSNLR